MDGNVGDVLLGGVVLRMAASTADAVRHQRSTQLAGVEDLLHLDVVRVKATHEADLQQTLAGSLLRLYDLLRVLEGGSQRLLAEYRLAGLDALYRQISVGAVPGCDNNSVDLGRSDQLLCACHYLCAVGLSDLLGTLGVQIVNSSQTSAVYIGCNVLRMGVANVAACAQYANSEFLLAHDVNLLFSFI